NKAKRDYEQKVRQLLKTIGRDGFVELKVETTFDLDLEDVYNLFKRNIDDLILEIPEYKIKKYKVEQTKLQEKIAKSDFYPTISASVGYGLSDTEFIPNYNKWSLSIGLKANYIVFNGFKNLNDLKIVNTKIKTAEIDLYDTKLNLQNNFYLLKNEFFGLKELLTVKEKYLKALEKQSEIITIKYANGLTTYYDWYQTEESFINLQKSLLNLKKELIISEIELKKFLGFIE
ncbi:MAG: TolC family protein, partial [Endomicrobiia bacterium]